MKRRTFLTAAATVPVSLTLFPANASATGDAIGQVVGVQNFTVGDWTVTALLDGSIPLGADAFANLTADEASEFLSDAFLDDGPVPTGVNAYVLRNADLTVLVDAGGAGAFPGLGGLSVALKAADIAPDRVTDVLLTHLHPDHIGGLLRANGAMFPNARLHVHQADIDFWTNADIRAQVPDDFKPFFDLAVAVVGTYGDQVEPFSADGELLPGIASRAMAGHTPGHSGFEISSGEDSLLIWGDLVAVAAFQFPKPEAAIAFDIDAEAAIEARKAVFAETAQNRTLVAGMHLPFPGIGHVAVDGDAYRFVPANWQFMA